jgi:hypothetical protein
MSAASPLGRAFLRAYASERDQFYGALKPTDRSFVVSKTTAIHERMKRTAEGIVATGRDLIAVKARLAHGQFRDWLKIEFDWSHDTARRCMSVAERFGEMTQIASFAPSALYLLSEPLTPPAAVDEALALAESGEKVTRRKAAAMVDRAITGHPGLIRVRGRVKIKPCVKGPFTPSATRYFGSEETEQEASRSLARIMEFIGVWKDWCALPCRGELSREKVETLRARLEKKRAALSPAAQKTCAAMVRD